MINRIRSAERARILAPGILVLAVLFGAVLTYLIGDAQRERNVQYGIYTDNIERGLELWAQTKAELIARDLTHAMADPVAGALYGARDFARLGALVHAALAEDFRDGDLDTLILRDAQGTVLFNLGADGSRRADTEAPDGDAAARAPVRLYLAPSGSSRLTAVIPWQLGGGVSAYFEARDENAGLAEMMSRRFGAQIFALPDWLSAPVDPKSLPPSLSSAFGGVYHPYTKRFAQMLDQILEPGAAGATGMVKGRPIDLLKLGNPPDGAFAHNRLLLVRDAQTREQSIRQSIASAILLAIALGGLIGFYALRTTRQLMDSLSREEAEKLRVNEERLRAIMNAVADGIMTMNEDGVVLSANPAAQAMFGYGPDALIGRPAPILSADESEGPRETVMARIRGELAGPAQVYKREMLGRRHDGAVFPMELAVSRGEVAGGPVYTGIVRDITERKAADDLLHETVREQKAAQQALRQRSNELVRAARQLSQARDRAEAANAAKSRFLATMSHELRTPMNGILGMTGLLIASPLTADQRSWAQTIKDSGDALLTLLNDILDLSKIEAGKLEVQHATFDPVTLARQVAATWGRSPRPRASR